MSDQNIGVVRDLIKTLTTKLIRGKCRECGSKLIHVDTTFFTPGPTGRVWTVAVPVCPRCDLKDDTARLVPTVVS